MITNDDYYDAIEPLTCGGNVTQEGILETPGYPYRSAPKQSCAWIIRVSVFNDLLVQCCLCVVRCIMWVKLKGARPAQAENKPQAEHGDRLSVCLVCSVTYAHTHAKTMRVIYTHTTGKGREGYFISSRDDAAYERQREKEDCL